MKAKERSIWIASVDRIPLEAQWISVKRPIASVLLVHGFSADLHEEGAFDQLANRFAEMRVGVARFSFRGHGGSKGTQEGMTIAGERLDLAAAYQWMTRHLAPPYAIVAASFGAVATLLQLQALQPRPGCIVLWNPVLDVIKVFAKPVTKWGRLNFSMEARRKALGDGYSLVDGTFRVGQVFLEEVTHYAGNMGLMQLGNVPTLVLHGTRDTYVPIATTNDLASMPNVRIVKVTGSDHGFPDDKDEAFVIEETVGWLVASIKGK